MLMKRLADVRNMDIIGFIDGWNYVSEKKKNASWPASGEYFAFEKIANTVITAASWNWIEHCLVSWVISP